MSAVKQNAAPSSPMTTPRRVSNLNSNSCLPAPMRNSDPIQGEPTMDEVNTNSDQTSTPELDKKNSPSFQLLLHSLLARWRKYKLARGFRQWQLAAMPPPDSHVQQLLIEQGLDIHIEARRLLLGAEVARAAAGTRRRTPMSTQESRQTQHQSHQCGIDVQASNFTPFELDILVLWAKTKHAKTFKDVDDRSIRDAMKFFRFQQYEDGNALFFEGDIGDTFYMVFNGTVAVYAGAKKGAAMLITRGSDGPYDNETVDPDSFPTARSPRRSQLKPDLTMLGKRVFTYRTGESFGETAMFTRDAKRTASAVAVGVCEVCELPKKIYLHTLGKFHEAFFEQAQKINFLQSLPLFQDWQRSRLSTVAELLKKRKLNFGDSLLLEGNSTLTGCFFILTGVVKLTKHIEIAPLDHKKNSLCVTSDNGNNLHSWNKSKKHHTQLTIELQTVGTGEIVAAEALVKPNGKATYSATAASSHVEVYALEEADALGFVGVPQSAVYQQLRAICDRTVKHHETRIEAAKRALREQQAMTVQDTVLCGDGDDAFVMNSLDKRWRQQQMKDIHVDRDAMKVADAASALIINSTQPAPLICDGVAPYLPHLRASTLVEVAVKSPQVVSPIATNPAGIMDCDPMNVITSPKMLSMCVKKFIFEHSDTLTADYPDRLQQQLATSCGSKSSIKSPRVPLSSTTNSWHLSSSPTSNTASTSTHLHPTARRRRTRQEEQDEQFVLDQQMKHLYNAKMHWDAKKQTLVLFPPPSRPNIPTPPSRSSRAKPTTDSNHTNRIRNTGLRQQLKSTQEAARQLVEEHLRKTSQRHHAHPGTQA